MGATTGKIKGAADSVVGKAKEALGKESGNPKLAAEGAAQDTKGRMQKARAEVKDAIENA